MELTFKDYKLQSNKCINGVFFLNDWLGHIIIFDSAYQYKMRWSIEERNSIIYESFVLYILSNLSYVILLFVIVIDYEWLCWFVWFIVTGSNTNDVDTWKPETTSAEADNSHCSVNNIKQNRKILIQVKNWTI